MEDIKYFYQKYINQLCTRCNCVTISEDSKNYECDHIIPICLASTRKEILYLNRLKNIRLICKKCNQEKRDKIEHPNLLEKFEKWQQEQ